MEVASGWILIGKVVESRERITGFDSPYGGVPQVPKAVPEVYCEHGLGGSRTGEQCFRVPVPPEWDAV